MRLFRTAIEELEGYIPGFQPRTEDFIKLNTNENPYPPSVKVAAAIRSCLDGTLRRYPDPVADEMRQKISSVYKVPKDWLMVGNGSDELLNLAFRCVLEKGDRVLVTEPTYVLYEVLAKMQEAKVGRVLLDEGFDLPEKINLRGVKLFPISNPNAPTGNLFSKERLQKICHQAQGLVLIDEAYADFASEGNMDLVHQFKNVLITRSFSKSFSLAGLRLGFAVGRPEMICMMMKLKDSYNVSRLSQAAGLAALNDADSMKQAVKRVIRDREFLTQKLRTMNFDVLPSEANFVFARHRTISAVKIYQGLYSNKILVRHFDRPRLRAYLRISIGTHQEMVKLVKVLEDILKGGKAK